MKTVTIRLEDPLHKTIKVQLALDEKTFQEYMLSLIEQDLKKRKIK